MNIKLEAFPDLIACSMQNTFRIQNDFECQMSNMNWNEKPRVIQNQNYTPNKNTNKKKEKLKPKR